jgi:acyl-CoA reductase-like NAD-dependent aldehyde dehydrogenase
MSLHGKNFIGTELSALGTKTFFGFDPRAGKQLETSFCEATEEEIDRSLQLAAQAFPVLRESSATVISGFLEAIASEIVRGKPEEELRQIADSLPVTLTATIHGTPEDL